MQGRFYCSHLLKIKLAQRNIPLQGLYSSWVVGDIGSGPFPLNLGGFFLPCHPDSVMSFLWYLHNTSHWIFTLKSIWNFSLILRWDTFHYSYGKEWITLKDQEPHYCKKSHWNKEYESQTWHWRIADV